MHINSFLSLLLYHNKKYGKMTISENINRIKADLPETVKLIAVSKRQPDEKLQEAIDCGHLVYGENIVQELVRKEAIFPKNIEWHMIGHLQRNKVKYIAPFISYIHSVDGESLLNEIQKRAAQNNRKIHCLFEVHIAKEDSKFGWQPSDLETFLNNINFAQYPNIIFAGLMGMATNTSDTTQIEQEFHFLKTFFDKLNTTVFAKNTDFKELSMGMSGDYPLAVKHGSTMIRVGTAIFGQRFSK
jgi:pyridoxal phosphate enzyme (YggS family)